MCFFCYIGFSETLFYDVIYKVQDSGYMSSYDVTLLHTTLLNILLLQHVTRLYFKAINKFCFHEGISSKYTFTFIEQSGNLESSDISHVIGFVAIFSANKMYNHKKKSRITNINCIGKHLGRYYNIAPTALSVIVLNPCFECTVEPR